MPQTLTSSSYSASNKKGKSRLNKAALSRFKPRLSLGINSRRVNKPVVRPHFTSQPSPNLSQQSQIQTTAMTTTLSTPTSEDRSPSPPPPKPTATTPGPRATQFNKLCTDALSSTLRATSYDSFADCFPTIAAQAPNSLRQMYKGFVEHLERFALVRTAFLYPFPFSHFPSFHAHFPLPSYVFIV